MDRQEGRLWGALWEQALLDRTDWVLVNSFNQWHNGTEIEPSAELGDRYLALTAAPAARFRGLGDPVPPARKPPGSER
jgi:hypothetical protein